MRKESKHNTKGNHQIAEERKEKERMKNELQKQPLNHHKIACMRAKSLQSCLTLCDTMESSLPGSTVYGILQARILE